LAVLGNPSILYRVDGFPLRGEPILRIITRKDLMK
jgi:hypothetical protein